jgi:hypothetical protein
MSGTTLKELCNGLRTNDPSITELSLQFSNRSSLSKLLKAVKGNFHVSSLPVDLNGWNFRCPTLCRYLSKSKALRSVTITCEKYSGCTGLPASLACAVAGNSHIDEVSFCGDVAISYWYDDLLVFLKSKKRSLKRFSIPYVHWTHELGLAMGSLLWKA